MGLTANLTRVLSEAQALHSTLNITDLSDSKVNYSTPSASGCKGMGILIQKIAVMLSAFTTAIRPVNDSMVMLSRAAHD